MSILPECPSPDGRENPFVPLFGIKDLEGQQEIAPKKSAVKPRFYSALAINSNQMGIISSRHPERDKALYW